MFKIIINNLRRGFSMLLNVLNVFSLFLLLVTLFLFIIYTINKIFYRNFNNKKYFIPLFTLFLGVLLLFIVQNSNNYINNYSKLYSDTTNNIPLSINLISGSQVYYKYNSKELYKGINDGQVYFRLNPIKLNNATELKIIQRYRNSFFVPTVEQDTFQIIRK